MNKIVLNFFFVTVFKKNDSNFSGLQGNPSEKRSIVNI